MAIVTISKKIFPDGAEDVYINANQVVTLYRDPFDMVVLVISDSLIDGVDAVWLNEDVHGSSDGDIAILAGSLGLSEFNEKIFPYGSKTFYVNPFLIKKIETNQYGGTEIVYDDIDGLVSKWITEDLVDANSSIADTSTIDTKFKGNVFVGNQLNGWQRAIFLNHRSDFEITIYTTGGQYGPGSITFNIKTYWTPTIYVTVISKQGPQYVHKIRFTSDAPGGGGGYLDVLGQGTKTDRSISVTIRPLIYTKFRIDDKTVDNTDKLDFITQIYNLQTEAFE